MRNKNIIRFMSVRLRNYGSYEGLDFTFRSGKKLVLGKNGSGKSSIFDAISSCLFKESREKDPSHNWKGNCSVEVDFMKGEDFYTVKRYWGCKGKSSPVLIMNEEDVSCRKSTDTEKEIERVVGMSSDLFMNIVAIAQGLPTNFCAFSKTIKKTVIEDLVGFAVWLEYQKKFDKERKIELARLDSIEEEYDEVKEEMVSSNSKLEAFEEAEKANSEDALKEIKDLKKRIKSIRKEMAELAELHEDMLEGQDIDEVNENADTIKDSVFQYKAKLRGLDRIIEDKTCPTCERPYPKVMISEAKEEQIFLRSKLKNMEKIHSELSSLIEEADNTDRSISDRKREEKRLFSQIEDLAEEIEKPKIDLTGLKKKVEILEGEVNEKKKDIEEIEGVLEKIDYVRGLLTPSSKFRTSVLLQYLYKLNTIMKNITSLLFPSVECKLRFEETKRDSGIDLEITRNGEVVSYKSLSGGEKKRVDLVVIFSFQRFLLSASGVSSNLLVFDEIFTDLDAEGVNATLSCIDSLFPESSCIYVITHREGIKECFDSFMRVTKVGGVSQIDIQP